MKKAIVAGHICLDLTPKFPFSTKLSDLNPGVLLNMDGIEISAGGAVANVGSAMQFFGLDVTAMGMIGKDYFGNTLTDILKQHKINARLKFTEKESTSFSIVIAPSGSDRAFLHCPGANNLFSAESIDTSLLNDAEIFHFGYPPIMRRMYENDGSELCLLFKLVKESDIITSLDMAMYDINSEAAKTDWKKVLQNTLPYVDIFVPSYDEICLMLGTKTPEALANDVISMGSKICLIKCGAKGFYIKASPNLSDKFEKWNGINLFKKAYEIENVISGTGAGDTCIAAFLTAFIYGYPPADCINYAAGAGACCCESYDALSGLKSFEEMKRRFKME